MCTITGRSASATLQKINGIKPEQYGFTWPGKRKAKAIAREPSDCVMVPCEDESVDWDTTQNIFI